MKDVRSIFTIEENFLIILSFFEEANGKSCFYLDSIAQTKNFKLFQNPYIYRLKALGFKDLTYWDLYKADFKHGLYSILP